jgi:hypothetical protein
VRRFQIGCGGLLLLLIAGGCSAPAGSSGTSRSSPPASPDGFGARRIVLACEDAIAASAADADSLKGNDFVFQGLSGQSESAPPRAEDVGLRLPPGVHWYFRKAPVVLRQGAPDVTIAVSGTGQALSWVPASAWTSGSPPDLTSWAGSSLTLKGCPDKAAMFLGGVLAAELTTCLQLHVRSGQRAETTLRQHLDGSPCM